MHWIRRRRRWFCEPFHRELLVTAGTHIAPVAIYRRCRPLSRRKKVLIVIAVVLVGLLLLVRPSFHLTTQSVSNNANYSCMTSGNPSPSFCRRIAIVSPSDKAGNRHLQAAVVRRLKERLTDEEFVPANLKWGRDMTSFQSVRPTVSTHTSVKAAVASRPDFVIIIKAPKWDYSMFPFSRTWDATVSWEGKQTARYIRSVIMGDEANVEMDGKLEIHGQTAGLFSTAYITGSAGDKAAESIVGRLKEEVEDLTEKWRKGDDKD